jgi:hypothetical protein
VEVGVGARDEIKPVQAIKILKVLKKVERVSGPKFQKLDFWGVKSFFNELTVQN